MASLSDEELPVEQPAVTPYPTAVDPADLPAASEDRDQSPAEIAPAKQKPDAIPIKTPANTPLAIVPSALRMNRTPDPIQVQMPAASSQPQAAPVQQAETPVVEAAAVSVENLPPIVTASDVLRPAAPAMVLPEPETHGSAGASPSHQTSPSQQASPPQTLPLHQADVQLPEERLHAIVAQRDVLIAMLEDEIRQRKSAVTPDPLVARLEQELRLLYAGAERVEDAARAVDSLSEPEREAYKNLMFGLSTWLTAEEARRAPLRNARVMRSLREAASELAAASKLDLRNLAFCERVQSYGWITEFVRNEFQPKQQVILYVEVDNFAAVEKSPTSFETELAGHYQIFDERGNIVAERKLPLDREVCRNFRRDYFLAYPIYMPDAIPPGRYRLELTVEDLKASGEYQGRKFGEGMIEFAIRG
jgi:hypothetical protein